MLEPLFEHAGLMLGVPYSCAEPGQTRPHQVGAWALQGPKLPGSPAGTSPLAASASQHAPPFPAARRGRLTECAQPTHGWA